MKKKGFNWSICFKKIFRNYYLKTHILTLTSDDEKIKNNWKLETQMLKIEEEERFLTKQERVLKAEMKLRETESARRRYRFESWW